MDAMASSRRKIALSEFYVQRFLVNVIWGCGKCESNGLQRIQNLFISKRAKIQGNTIVFWRKDC